MKLIIKNISSIKHIDNPKIKIRSVDVQPDMYRFSFYNHWYYNNWDCVIHRDKENVGDSYDVELTDTTNTNHWERYTLTIHQMKDVQTFFDKLDEMCYDFDVINNK
jgi:hypothetical protein